MKCGLRIADKRAAIVIFLIAIGYWLLAIAHLYVRHFDHF